MTEFATKIAPQGSRDTSLPRPLQRVASSKEGSRSRSAHGCWTCRLRRKKCDEKGPECVTCTDRGLKCSGFGAIKPRWMDGGAQQEAIHQEIKSTVASVTRMKRMMKLVQAREKASPGRRSAPPEVFENAGTPFFLQEGGSSGTTSRAASVGPSQMHTIPSHNQQWTPELPSGWNIDNFNSLPVNDGNIFYGMGPEYYPTVTEDHIHQINSIADSSFYPSSQPGDGSEFYHYSTPEPEIFPVSNIQNGADSAFNNLQVQPCVFPPSPALSVSILEAPESRRQGTPSRLQEVFCHDDTMISLPQFEQRGSAKRATKVPLSPVCEVTPPRASEPIVKRQPLLLPKAECPRPCNQVNISSLERTAQATNSHIFNDPRSQLLRNATIELAKLQSLLYSAVNQDRNASLRDAVAWVLRIRDDYLLECESPAMRVLSEADLASLGNSIRFIAWADITARTFEGAEIESPFRGHISRLLDASIQSRYSGVGPAEDWIYTGIESVTRLAQMRAQLASEGVFDFREFQHHESSVLANLEFRLGADDPSVQLDAKTMLRRSIFLHSIMIYFYVVVQGPFAETFDIRKNVDIVIRDLLSLNDPEALTNEFVWPFLVAASMAGREHHKILFELFNRCFGCAGHPRLANAFEVVKECWSLRAQGVPADWRVARGNMMQRGFMMDTACW
ncbi:hypothetical protein BJ875DRAFT_481112 [Amylocarpus encephaloides]|uniref:Zn(2)-C6 fungal-type domain-containing protein n=1 Tax=Amylocarpus encephaloides TaxID=45428 RepID=A0A9P7YQ50_9HELO|nr:hypothetical protein BJ875DRAFT_481112 [Amylocarpus encephaloides]